MSVYECRDAPTGLSALLCRAALTRLLTDDLSPFHWSQEAEPEDGEEEVRESFQLRDKTAPQRPHRRYQHSVGFSVVRLPSAPSSSPVCLCAVFQSEGVQRVFINKMIEVALEWNQDPPTLPPSTFQCGVHAIKNGRRKMEDKHVLLSEFNALFGVEVCQGLQAPPPPCCCDGLHLSVLIRTRTESGARTTLCSMATRGWTPPALPPLTCMSTSASRGRCRAAWTRL